MNSIKRRISAVPTNIITGFLGVGKTSAILYLLKNKPTDERWAVLVNEFGEIGVDGSIIEAQQNKEQGVFIREVPGGCMCCAAGVSMQIALNQLLSQSKPDRLLIEPTGLGHPKEVLQALSTEHYQEVLSLQKTLCLVDARKLANARYTSHETFNQQIELADVIVGNKLDLYRDEDKTRLIEYAKQKGQGDVDIIFTQYGEIEATVLEGATSNNTVVSNHHHHDHSVLLNTENDEIPECGYIKAENQGEGFQSIGWLFSNDKVFNRKKLFRFLSGLSVDRMKAVFITNEGHYAYNIADDALTETKLDDSLDSRIELISERFEDSLETQLLACFIDHE